MSKTADRRIRTDRERPIGWHRRLKHELEQLARHDLGCLSEMQLAAFREGRLSIIDRVEVELHLRQCPLCGKEAELLKEQNFEENSFQRWASLLRKAGIIVTMPTAPTKDQVNWEPLDIEGQNMSDLVIADDE